MLLITGATGFIGRVLTNKLIQSGKKIRLLIRPQQKTPQLQKEVAFDVAISGLDDLRGLQSAMRNVDTIIHLSTVENQPDYEGFERVDIQGTENLVAAAKIAGVNQIIFISRIGADKNSSFPVFRAKALAEEFIMDSGIDFTIFRTTDVFGRNDNFTEKISSAIQTSFLILPIPAGDHIFLQPLWIEDLVSSIMIVLGSQKYRNKVLEIGGGEFFSLTKVIRLILQQNKKKRFLMQISPAYLRILNLWIRGTRDKFSYSNKWLDLLAIDRTCALDSLSKRFGIIPARFENQLTYLQDSKSTE
jgi:uncharacterized protein YbjT (DUF2867 family)